MADSFANMGIELTQDEDQALETIAMDSVMDAAKLNQYTSFIGNIMASRISSLWTLTALPLRFQPLNSQLLVVLMLRKT